MPETFFKIDHRYNTKPFDVPSLFAAERKRPIVPTMLQLYEPSQTHHMSDRYKPRRSFRYQINQTLQEWHRLRKEKSKYQLQQQQQQQQQVEKKSFGFWGDRSQEYDQFDRIMEKDLANQLKELEHQEERQMKKTERIIEQELKNNSNNNQDTEEFQRYCMELSEEYEKKQKAQNYAKKMVFKQDKPFQFSTHRPLLQINHWINEEAKFDQHQNKLGSKSDTTNLYEKLAVPKKSYQPQMNKLISLFGKSSKANKHQTDKCRQYQS